MAISLYRKYRPEVFADVVGQEHIEKTLVNAINTGSLAHAYLFCGPRGTGKTTTARLLAKALLCEDVKNGQPCGACDACKQISAGTHADVYELDAASRTGVENVREEIIARVQFAPIQGKYKVYIIDEVHMLSTAAFNALLKTLEEPPEHVIFVLCTTDPQKVPDTIQSRCQRFDFRRLSTDEITKYLQRICDGENFNAQVEALEYIAAQSDGGMRDATTTLEQVATSAGSEITLEAAQSQLMRTSADQLFKLGSSLAASDVAACFLQLNEIILSGADLLQFSQDLAQHVRNLYLVSFVNDGQAADVINCLSADLPRYKEQAALFGSEYLAYALEICGELEHELKSSLNGRLDTELALLKICHPQNVESLQAVMARLDKLEKQLSGATVVANQGAGQQLEAQSAQVKQVAQAHNGEHPGVEQQDKNDEHLGANQQDKHDEHHTTVEQAKEPAQEQVDQPLQTKRQEASIQEEPVGQLEEQPEEQALQEEPAEQQQEQQQQNSQEEAAQTAQPAQTTEDAQDAQPAQTTQAVSSGIAMSSARLTAAVIAEVKALDMPTSTLLAGVKVNDAGNDSYVFTFPKDAAFSMKIASKNETLAIIKKGLCTVVGKEARASLVLDDGNGSGNIGGANIGSNTSGNTSGSANGNSSGNNTGAVPDSSESAFDSFPSDNYMDGYPEDYAASHPDDYADAYGDESAYNEFDYQGGVDANQEFDYQGNTGVRQDEHVHKQIDAKTEQDLSQILSAFGQGTKFEEIDSDDEGNT